MIPDLVKSFVHPYQERTPSFDFLLTNHIFRDVNFRSIDYSAYFFAFFSSFIFIIPETQLEQELRITRAYYQFMPDNAGLKCVFVLHQVDDNGVKMEKYSMQIRNVFFNQNYKKWRRGLSYDDYRELENKLVNVGIDIKSCECNVEEYLIRPTEVYKEGTTTFDSKKKFRVIVQKLKVHDAMVQSVAPDGYPTTETSSKFTRLQQLIVDALVDDRKPIEDTVLAMEENQLTGNEYLENIVKPFLMQIPEIYQMVSAFYAFKLPETRLSLCGFTHGAITALSRRLRITPKIFHHIALIYNGQDLINEDRLYLSLEPIFQNAVDIQQTRTPIMISFANRQQPFVHIPMDDMSAMTRLGVRSSLDNKRIMTLMNYAFGQGVTGTIINYPENNKVFARTLVKMFDEISNNKFGTAAILHNYVSHVISSILHTDVAYNIDKIQNYLSRYFLSMISITQENNGYAAFVEKPTKADEVNFVFKSTLKKKTILLKFVESSMPMEIRADTTNYFPSVEDGWDTLVITVEQHFEHSKNEFSLYENDEIEDFVNRQVMFNYDKFANVKPKGEMILLNHWNLETHLDNSDDLRMSVSTFFNKFSCLIQNEHHIKALFDGLLHKIPHAKLSQRFLEYQVAIPRDGKFRLFNFKKSNKKMPSTAVRQLERNFPGIESNEVLNVYMTEEGQVSIEKVMPQPPCTRRKRSNACVPYKHLTNLEDTIVYGKPSMKKTLGTMRTIAGNVMAGFMIRDVIGDLIRGDTSAALMDGSLAVGSILANELAGCVESYGVKMMESGKTVLRAGLKAAGLVLRRIVSVYILRHLIQSINQYKLNRNDTSLKVHIATDSAFLVLDAMESSVEAMELFGVVEGLSSITGPVGALLGAILITGSNIYQTVHTMKYINSKVRLNFVEEIEVTLSTMMHLNPGQQILNFIKARDANEHIKKHAISFLQNQTQIKYYITEAASLINGVCLKENDTIIDLRSTELFENSKANPSNETDFKLFCEIPDDSSHHKMVVRERKSLWHRITDGLENFLWDVKLLKDVLKGDLDWIIYDAMHLDPKDVTHSYVCHQSFGIANQNSTSDVAFFQLDTGYDKIHGFLDNLNIFNLSDGQKEIFGGHLNDIFIINGKNITGVLEGAGGTNQLYFSAFDPRGIIHITVKRFSHLHIGRNNTLFLLDMNEIYGRAEASDIIECTCNHTYIDLKGGSGFGQNMMDVVQISPMNSCSSYNTEIIVNSYTVINNTIGNGTFSYHLNHYTNISTIEINGTKEIQHKIYFPFNIVDLTTISYSTNSTVNEISLSSPLCQNVSIILHGNLSSLEMYYADEAVLSLKKTGHFLIHLKTDMLIEKVVKTYYDLIKDFNLTMVAYSTTDNKSVTFSNGLFSEDGEAPLRIHVMHTDPYHASHVHCVSGDLILIINETIVGDLYSIKMPDLTVDSTNLGCSKIVLDFSAVLHKLSDLHPNLDLSINALSHWPDIKLIITLENKTHVRTIGQIFLSSAQDISEKDFIGKFEIINHGQRQTFKYQTMENDEFKYNISHNQPGYDGYDLIVHVEGDGGSSEILYDHNLSLQPEPLVFNRTATLIYITFRDVEYDQIIIIDKQIEYYKFYRINDTLVITNIFEKCFFDRENLLTIVVENFYIWIKLQTLNFKFKNDNLNMINEHGRAGNITGLWDQIIVNDEIFF